MTKYCMRREALQMVRGVRGGGGGHCQKEGKEVREREIQHRRSDVSEAFQFTNLI